LLLWKLARVADEYLFLEQQQKHNWDARGNWEILQENN
jgi:hypothetical protein